MAVEHLLVSFLLVSLRPVLATTVMEPHWGNWGSVSGCSKTCGFGTEERTRYLIVGGVVNHEKKETQIYQCYLTNCPVDGNWTQWGGWSLCDKICGPGGIQKRVRYCADPYPSYDGKVCEGPTSETRACVNNTQCPEIPENFDISICENNNKTVWCTSHLHCVLKEKVCDRVLHCHDGSDESMCPAKFRNAGSVAWRSNLQKGLILIASLMLTALKLTS